MAKKVTEQEKEKMWKLYQQMGTYTAVAKKLHRDRKTVARYVQETEAAIRATGYILNQMEREKRGLIRDAT